jgi:hypothetical protein
VLLKRLHTPSARITRTRPPADPTPCAEPDTVSEPRGRRPLGARQPPRDH